MLTVVYNALSGNDDALGFGKDEQSSEEEEEEQPRALRRGRHRLEDEGMQADEDTFQTRDAKSEEMEDESSREWENSKRWNKMDELAKQLTSKKRMEENDSGEDPDRSMKMAFRSHKYDFSSPEEGVRRSRKHHSKEDSSEGFPLAPMPEEKKDEEGSANRRTEVGAHRFKNKSCLVITWESTLCLERDRYLGLMQPALVLCDIKKRSGDLLVIQT